MNDGADFAAALQEAFSLSPEDLERELRAYYKRAKSRGLPVRRFQGFKLNKPTITLRQLPAAEDAALPLDMRLAKYPNDAGI